MQLSASVQQQATAIPDFFNKFSLWKHAIIVSIPKPGKNLRILTNHRPISLLPSVSKLLERVIQTRSYGEIEELQILSNEQFGFRRNHSAGLSVTKEIAKGFQYLGTSGAIFLDAAKAFDKVWHPGLLFKKFRIGIVRLIASFLSDRTFQVLVSDRGYLTPKPETFRFNAETTWW